MKVMLLFPPNWTPTMPHLALPTLTAFLRRHGVEVIQRDLNLEIFDDILTEKYMRNVMHQLRKRYGAKQAAAHRNQHRDTQSPPAEVLQWAFGQGSQLAHQVEQAKAVMRSADFFDGPRGLRAFKTVVECLELASLPFYPANLHLQSYQAAGPVDSSRDLLKLVRDRETNIFLDYFRRGVIADIAREQPDVVGISIPSMPQMLAGMTLAHLIKEAGLPCHVTVGGPHISMLREPLTKVAALFTLIDSAVIMDGEEALLQLVKAVSHGHSLATVPNLIYRDGDAIRVNERHTPEKIKNLPLPDFDGLPLGRYLAPQQALPLLTARGCYFGKCAFCNTGYGIDDTFSQLQAEQVVEQMMTLYEKYGVRHIFFSDEAITPRNLKNIAPLLTELGAPIQWGGCTRFEKIIDRSVLDKIYAAGCRMILFGLESASQPVMDKMVKGTQLGHMSRILQESTAAGIWNHTFFFFGFPGETLEDAQQTVNFLYQHKPFIHSAAIGSFLMERDSPAHRYPASFGVNIIFEDPDKDLAIYFDYDVNAGMKPRMAELVESRFLESLPDRPYPQYYVSDVYRFLYASHLSERGVPHPPWLEPEAVLA
ncbi:MAG TPA: radical SAM protein [Caldilineaceae bacterium]|mgnify:CR=1 FL=1|nr:radical SAM protein [Caldilineaceae bacterium]